VLDELATFQKATPNTLAAGYAIAAIPARYAVERQDWAAAAALAAPAVAFPWQRFPWTPAMIAYARALGAAHTGDFAGARAEIDKLQAAHDVLIAAKNAYWAGQVSVQVQSAKAVLAFAEGRKDEALSLMRAAADADDAAEKSPVTPGSILPAREMLADMLLEAQQPALALAEYERSLEAAPNRFRSLAGAGSAAEQAGDASKARLYRQRLVGLSGEATPDRPEVLAAKQYLDKG